MNRYFLRSAIVCMSFSIIIAVKTDGADPRIDRVRDLHPKQLLADKREDREKSLDQLNAHYLEISKALTEALEKAATNNKSDHNYHSPLHCAIIAVDMWNVLKADMSLLAIVDYELDISSLPVGGLKGRDYAYPAASALVHLRVEPQKVVDAIKASKDNQCLRVLTWVLSKRVEPVAQGLVILENAQKASENNEKKNLEDAIKLLERPSDILPSPSQK